MSKSTRIVELVHMLGGRRSRTVAEIAETLEVSDLTTETVTRPADFSLVGSNSSCSESMAYGDWAPPPYWPL